MKHASGGLKLSSHPSSEIVLSFISCNKKYLPIYYISVFLEHLSAEQRVGRLIVVDMIGSPSIHIGLIQRTSAEVHLNYIVSLQFFALKTSFSEINNYLLHELEKIV